MIQNIKEYVANNILLFDGAMGTMLQKAGLPAGECPEKWNITNPKAISHIHTQYIDAGAQVITTNTFGGSRTKLTTYGLENDCFAVNFHGVKIAKEAARDRALVAASMGPTGKLLQPMGELSFDEAYEMFKEQVLAFAKAGADLVIVETMVDLQETRAALLAVKENSSLPVICSITFDERMRTLTGSDPITVATVLEGLGTDILGANCSGGPEQLLPVIEQMASVCAIPIIVQPNAGLPELIDNETVFRLSPEIFASFAPQLIEAGASCIGGCCGTTPQHIEKLHAAVKNLQPRSYVPYPVTRIAGRTSTIFISHNLPPIIVGERINPTGRSKLAEDIRSGSMSLVRKEAIEQVQAGAAALDVNMGVPGIDEPNAMKEAIQIIQSLTGVPLSIDTTNPEALEVGLRYFCGKALINSINAEDQALENLLPIAKKYGATILGLPLDGCNLPLKAEERFVLAKKIIEAAQAAGIPKHNIVLDGLCLTAGAQQEYAYEAIRAIQMYKAEFGVATTLGVSNVSFGMPRRDILNSTFLAMALSAGLNVAIINPHDARMKETFLSAKVLMDYDKGGKNYIRYTQQTTLQESVNNTNLNPLQKIHTAVVQGEKSLMKELVNTALAAGESTLAIVNQALIPAMEDIGTAYFKGDAFLPQVLLAAEAMRSAFNVLKNSLQEYEIPRLGTVVLATVKGDIHDLGKNIVGALLENTGFKVVDLGKDVSADSIVKAAINEKADIVGLSALMTTTMPEMKIVIEKLRQNNISAKVMVGGAVVTQEYADSILADSYAKDALEALQKAKRLVEK
jgi:5-methyltetrahydrofolate--homocysteine methyltransferase